MIVLGQHYAKLAGCLLVVVVSLAEALDKLRVSQGACKTCLALILLQLVEKLVAIGVGSHLVEIVEQEVASVDDTVEVGINSLDVGVGGLDVLPTVDVAIGIRVALHAEYEVGLQIGQNGKIARIQGAALEAVVDTYHQLVHILYCIDSLVHTD